VRRGPKTKLPPGWRVYTNRRARPRLRLTRGDVRLGGLAAGLAFLGVFAALGGGVPGSPDRPGLSVEPHFRNCAAAREAGATPIRRGEPGYGPHLDRDRDGVGCEWG